MSQPPQALSAHQNLAAAFTRVCDSVNGWAPYFGSVLRGLVRREFPPAMLDAYAALKRTPTIGVTAGMIMYWHPPWVAAQETDELAAVLMHEAMHVLLNHIERGNAIGATTAEKAFLANLAGDMSINEELRKARKLPGSAVYPETFGQPLGLVMEVRYHLLLEEVKSAMSKIPSPGAGSGQCGSCGGNPMPGEPDDQNSKRSPAEIERFRKETAEAVKSAAAGPMRGTIPDGLLRWADEQLAPPKIDWRKQLTAAVKEAVAYRPGAVDFDWTRPSRRQAGLGYGIGRPIAPSYRAPQPRVAVVVDTSGSMSNVELVEAASELNGILEAVGAQVTVCACDAAVHELRDVESVQEAVKLFVGGGGTDMRPALDALAERTPRPEVCIVVTDGAIGDPGPEPAFRVVWVLVGGSERPPASWGDVIVIEREEEKKG